MTDAIVTVTRRVERTLFSPKRGGALPRTSGVNDKEVVVGPSTVNKVMKEMTSVEEWGSWREAMTVVKRAKRGVKGEEARAIVRQCVMCSGGWCVVTGLTSWTG